MPLIRALSSTGGGGGSYYPTIDRTNVLSSGFDDYTATQDSYVGTINDGVYVGANTTVYLKDESNNVVQEFGGYNSSNITTWIKFTIFVPKGWSISFNNTPHYTGYLYAYGVT